MESRSHALTLIGCTVDLGGMPYSQRHQKKMLTDRCITRKAIKNITVQLQKEEPKNIFYLCHLYCRHTKSPNIYLEIDNTMTYQEDKLHRKSNCQMFSQCYKFVSFVALSGQKIVTSGTTKRTKEKTCMFG